MDEEIKFNIKSKHLAIIAFSILLGLLIASAIQTDRVIDQYNELSYKYNEECIIVPESYQISTPLTSFKVLPEGVNNETS